MYDAQADSIKVEDIASNENNRIMLGRIKRNNPEDHDKLYIQNRHDEDGEECVDYVPEDTNDMGWLGYFVGRNEQLQELHLRSFTPTSGLCVLEVLEPFFRGIGTNKSIFTLDFYDMDLLDGRVFTLLGPFFEHSPTLTDLTITECNLGDDGWRLLALAIGSSKNKSLKTVSLIDCNVSDEGLVDIITALSMHPHLQKLFWNGNRLSTKGCMTLATLLRCSCTELKLLDLSNNEINDEGIQALVPGLKNCSHLETLRLNNNTSITSRGWVKLASILEPPNSRITDLNVQRNNIDDIALATFAIALTNNHTLEQLYFNGASISIEGQVSRVFSKLLCDTSSINSTFLSNHTLQYVSRVSNNAQFRSLFKLNKRDDKKQVAMIKILKHHNDFDMMPFFEWEFKVLPLMIGWFERASSITMPENFESSIGPRKLSSIYQFVRGMPLLYVETCIRKEVEGINSKETQLDEQHLRIEKKQLQLRREQLMLDLELQQIGQRKQSIKEHKESLLEKLGR